MAHRPIRLALALAAALCATAAPVWAQQSPAPAPSGSPEPVATAAPAAEPSPAHSEEPSPSPSPEAAPGRTLRGTLESIKGTVATVKLANGTMQTYTVSAKAAALLKKSIGKKLVFRVLRGALDVLPH